MMYTDSELTGVVLIGGMSSRMGSPKHLINYHGEPQYLHVYNLLNEFCSKVYFSVTADQDNLVLNGYNLITDCDEFKDAGPISGVLSVFKIIDGPLIVVACDYPYLNKEDLEVLITSRDTTKIATVYNNPDDNLPEPLICVYELRSKDLLIQHFNNKEYSLRKFLAKNEIKIIEVQNRMSLKSVDFPAEFESANQYFNNLNS